MSIWFCQLDSPSSLVELVGLVPVCRVSNALNFQNGALKKKLVGDTHSKTFGPNPNDIRPCLNLLFPPHKHTETKQFQIHDIYEIAQTICFML